MNARKDNNEDAAKLVHEIFSNEDKAKIIRNAYLNELKKKPVRAFTPEEALALSISLDLSKAEYKTLVNDLKTRNFAGILPSYNLLQEAASKCCLHDSDIHVTESGVHLKLQALLDLTVARLLQLHEKALLEGCSACHFLKYFFGLVHGFD